MRRSKMSWAVAATAGLAGCTVPLPLAHPESPRTVGERRVRVHGWFERHGLELAEELDTDDASRVAKLQPREADRTLGPTPFRVALAAGLTDDIDLEVGVDGAVDEFFFIGGAHLGARVQVVRSERLVLTFFGEFGGARASHNFGETSVVWAGGGLAAAVTLQNVELGASFATMRATAELALDRSGESDFTGVSATGTLFVGVNLNGLRVAPFVALSRVPGDLAPHDRAWSYGLAIGRW